MATITPMVKIIPMSKVPAYHYRFHYIIIVAIGANVATVAIGINFTIVAIGVIVAIGTIV